MIWGSRCRDKDSKYMLRIDWGGGREEEEGYVFVTVSFVNTFLQRSKLASVKFPAHHYPDKRYMAITKQDNNTTDKRQPQGTTRHATTDKRQPQGTTRHDTTSHDTTIQVKSPRDKTRQDTTRLDTNARKYKTTQCNTRQPYDNHTAG